jgi:hypothetical protein
VRHVILLAIDPRQSSLLTSMKTAFKPGERPNVGSDFRVGRFDCHNPQIACLVPFLALRGMLAGFGPTGAGNRRAGEKGGAVEPAITFPSVLFLEELSPRKPENPARHPDRR